VAEVLAVLALRLTALMEPQILAVVVAALVMGMEFMAALAVLALSLFVTQTHSQQRLQLLGLPL
jgi:hypothetical protein